MKESKVRKYVEEGWIHAKMIFEVAGKPEKHVNDMLKQLVDGFEKEKNKI